jgi:putative ABC transport system permease protein
MALEALWLAVLGSLVGGVITLALSVVINTLQIEMPPPPAAVDPITLSLLIRPSDFLWTALFMATLLVLASVPPMLRVLRLQVVEALGHV